MSRHSNRTRRTLADGVTVNVYRVRKCAWSNTASTACARTGGTREPAVLVMNVLRFRDGMDVDHLTFDDARRLVDGIRPGVAIMSHFSTRMHPDQIQRMVEKRLPERLRSRSSIASSPAAATAFPR